MNAWIHQTFREPYFDWLHKEIETMKVREQLRQLVTVIMLAEFKIGAILSALNGGQSHVRGHEIPVFTTRIRETFDLPCQGDYTDFKILHSVSQQPENWNYNR